MKSEVYCAFVGIDRSDAWLDLSVESADGKLLGQCQMPRSPAKWKNWLLALHKRCSGGRIAVCFEQPASNLIAFFREAKRGGKKGRQKGSVHAGEHCCPKQRIFV
mgnify:CR=1 FL=1